jgi:hypothetical protein
MFADLLHRIYICKCTQLLACKVYLAPQQVTAPQHFTNATFTKEKQ